MSINNNQNFKSIIQIVDIFRDLSDYHKQINDFGYGPEYEISRRRNMNYPFMWISFDNSTNIEKTPNGYSIVDYNITVRVFDKLNNGLADDINIDEDMGEESNNGLELTSDCSSILMDIIQLLSSHPMYNKMGLSLENDISISYEYDSYDDGDNGAVADLTIRTMYDGSWCIAPVDILEYDDTFIDEPNIRLKYLTCGTLGDCSIIQDLQNRTSDNYYTTDAYLDGNILKFNRNDIGDAYQINLSTLSPDLSGYLPLAGGNMDTGAVIYNSSGDNYLKLGDDPFNVGLNEFVELGNDYTKLTIMPNLLIPGGLFNLGNEDDYFISSDIDKMAIYNANSVSINSNMVIIDSSDLVDIVSYNGIKMKSDGIITGISDDYITFGLDKPSSIPTPGGGGPKPIIQYDYFASEIQIRNNIGGTSSVSTNNDIDNGAVFIGSKGSTINLDVLNSVVIAGQNLEAIEDDTLYTDNFNIKSVDNSISTKVLVREVNGKINQRDFPLPNEDITIELIDALSVDFYNSYDIKIDSIVNITLPSTYTILVNDIAYTFGTIIITGSKITVNSISPTVINLITERI